MVECQLHSETECIQGKQKKPESAQKQHNIPIETISIYLKL